MGKTPAFVIVFSARPSEPGVKPMFWEVNHDGPIEDARRAAEGTIAAGTYPDAVTYWIEQGGR